ncbi:hypothetical protein EDD16DRAFT_1559477 [Pisolithus croceorrhizus]|nr:hypothetical protein EDD16DRAFT_1559477 [Pisolithus croceorrhizus]
MDSCVLPTQDLHACRLDRRQALSITCGPRGECLRKSLTYYAILGLTSDAGDSEIRAAYKKLALQWHPDRHLSGKEHAAQIFIEVNTAYHVLMDGKESTHSVPPENSSATSCSNTGSTVRSPPVIRRQDSKKSSRTKRSRNAPPSSSTEGRRRRPAKSESDHASSTHSSATCNDARSRPENKAEERSNFDRMKADSNTDHQSEKPSHGRADESRTDKPVIPPSSGRLHKSSRFGLADDFIHRLSRGTKGGKDRQEFIPHVDDVPPSESPLRTSKEWMFPLPMTLEEIFYGSRHRFLIKRELLSHKIEEVEICVRVPAGTRTGTRITGLSKMSSFWSRMNLGKDLYLDIRVPWQDSLADRGGDIYIDGLDGEEIVFPLPYPIHDNTTEGQVFVKGAGMPTRHGHKIVGRGDMIVRWQVVFTVPSKWEAFKRAFRVKL